MKVKKLFFDAGLPQKAHAGDLGYDLFSLGVTTIYPGQTELVSTGICIQFPEGYGALIRDRSSVATKRNLDILGKLKLPYIMREKMFNESVTGKRLHS
jgi:dUTP pyrophosphatase